MTDEPNVYTLRGDPIVDNRQSVDTVIEGLETMLEMARSGEIVSYAMVALCHDYATFTSIVGKPSWHVVGRMEAAKLWMVNTLS